MKKYLNLCIIVFITIGARAQKTDSGSTITLDLLNAPSNPAFNLLGISPSVIDRPTDLNAFRLSLQNATNGFTKIPSDYGFEIAPANLFNVKDQTLGKFNSKHFHDYFWQSLSVSLGVNRSDSNDVETNDSLSYTKIGIGVKFSIFRPRWNDTTGKIYAMLQALIHNKTNELTEEVQRLNTMFPEYNALEEKMQQLTQNTEFKTLHPNEYEDSVRKLSTQKFQFADKIKFVSDSLIKKLASQFKIVRKGWFLDLATGMVLDFPHDRFDNSTISKAGAWLTGGYENGDHVSVLGIVRYLYQPDKIFADDTGKLNSKNISTLDGGGRITVNALQNKFTGSAEAIYRGVLNANTIKPSWRLDINLEYSIGNNKKITCVIGRNFDGTITKNGNLLAAINLVAGFGSSKRL